MGLSSNPQDLISRFGPDVPISPVVLTVPHAGRNYGADLLALARLPQAALASLEDRYADLLVVRAVADGAVALVAQAGRAWIDLNRDPREIDPAVADAPGGATGLLETVKLKGGLGLIPRRVVRGGELWRRRLSAKEVAGRIDRLHTPWHAAIASALAAARSRFGEAVLIDCHSMPPLVGDAPARLVLGDRFGRSAGPSLIGAIMAAARAANVRIVRNAPYAGGYTLDHHGRPQEGVHAIQLEVCRSLYLDPAGDAPSAGLAAAQALVAGLAAAARAAILAPPAIAAE